MNLLDENDILDLRNYNQDFNWREYRDIIPYIKRFNVKGFKHDIDFRECDLFNKNNIDFLDLSEFKGDKINFSDSNISFNKVNVKNSKGKIIFEACRKIGQVDFLDLSEFKGKEINFHVAKIFFNKISLKNSKGDITFSGSIINEIDFLDLSEFKGDSIDFSKSNIIFKKISVENCFGDIYFYECNELNFIEYLDLKNYKGKYISFDTSNIKFNNIFINTFNYKLNFEITNVPKELRKTFDLSKGIESGENAILLKYHTENDLLKLYKNGLINLTKLKHNTLAKDIYNWFKNEVKDDFNLFESLISFNSFYSF